MQNVAYTFCIFHFTFLIKVSSIMTKTLLLLLLLPVFACGQAVKKAYAFYVVQPPGNIPVDDDGKPLGGIDTLRFLYLEVAGNTEPIVSRAEYRGRVYDAAVHPEQSGVIMNPKKGKDIAIRFGPNSRLYRVEITEGIGRSAYSSKMILRVLLNKKRFTVTVGQEVELEPEIRN